VAAGTLYAAILRSPHAHADIVSIDTSRAVTMPGVQGLVTGEDARRWTRPFTAAIKSPIEHWCVATSRVRYAGEPVAVVVAETIAAGKDTVGLVDIAYEPPAAMARAADAVRPLWPAPMNSAIVEGEAAHYDHYADDDHWEQPGNLFRLMTPAQQQVLFENTARAMGDARQHIKERHIANCLRADPAWGRSVARALGLELPLAAE